MEEDDPLREILIDIGLVSILNVNLYLKYT